MYKGYRIISVSVYFLCLISERPMHWLFSPKPAQWLCSRNAAQECDVACGKIIVHMRPSLSGLLQTTAFCELQKWA